MSDNDKTWGLLCEANDKIRNAYDILQEAARTLIKTAPHEMTVSEFARARNRMCLFHLPFCNGCTVLPERKEFGEVIHDCPLWTLRDPDKAVAIVEAWAQEHPEKPEKRRKTYAEDFKERCPNHLHNCGMPIVCRNEVYGFGGRCTVEEAVKRGGCSSCWNAEMEGEDE